MRGRTAVIGGRRAPRAGWVGAIALVASAGGGIVEQAPALTRSIEFAGREWTVKGGPGSAGPGPNDFSPDSQSVWVDDAGRLHLRISRRGGRWTCAEVVGAESLGHGTYAWTLDSPVDRLDPNVVLGLFTWSDTPEFAHREIDIELARWGEPRGPNAQYTVQPYRAPGHLRRFEHRGPGPTRHAFTWRPGRVAFTSSGAPGWTYAAADVPPAGDERPRMNLWLLDGAAPSDGRPVEVVIRDFTFTPAGDAGRRLGP